MSGAASDSSLSGDDDMADDASEAEPLMYSQAEDYPVLDTAMLPLHLREQCQDKPVYWMERTLAGRARSLTI